jgi:O-antigen/teichoic acid export membrane protein
VPRRANRQGRAPIEDPEGSLGPESEPDWPDVPRAAAFWTDRAWWRRAGSTSIALWGGAAIAFLGSVVAARELGPSGFGSVVLAAAVATLVATLLDLTLEQGLVHHGSRALAEQDLGGLRTLLRIALVVDVALGLAVAVLIFGVAEPLADFVGGGELDPSLVRIAALITFAGTVDGTTTGVLFLARRPDLRAWVVFATNVGRLAGVLVGVQIGGPQEVLAGFAFAAVATSVIQGVLAWRVGWRHWKTAEAGGRVREWIGKLISFGIYSSITTTIAAARRSVVPVFLGSLSGPGTVAIFTVALVVFDLAALASEPLRMALFPEQARQAAEGDVHGLRRVIRGVTAIGLAVALPAAVAGWFLLPILLPAIYSAQYEDAVLPARILLIAAVTHLALGWARPFFPAIGRPKLQTIYQFAFAILVLAAMALLARYGSTGAAIAYTFTYVATNVPLWFVANRILGQVERLPPEHRASGLAKRPQSG